jgi:hypothetical protein
MKVNSTAYFSQVASVLHELLILFAQKRLVVAAHSTSRLHRRPWVRFNKLRSRVNVENER